MSVDQETADKFANSWNNVYDASVYTHEQFLDWISPWTVESVSDESVMELGCGSGAILTHLKTFNPKTITGIDLGSSIETAKKLLQEDATIEAGDLTDHKDLESRFGQQDRVYSIGVLHHLTEPEKGVESLLSLTKPGGSFHGWVYAHEGNFIVRAFVDPLRKVVNHLPWWFNKYLVALPLSVPFLMVSKTYRALSKILGEDLPLPLFRYMLWISKRNLSFHHHVAFDQLVTPMTHYIKKQRVETWLSDSRVDPDSTYLEFRNGNGWKFGGKIKKETS